MDLMHLVLDHMKPSTPTRAKVAVSHYVPHDHEVVTFTYDNRTVVVTMIMLNADTRSVNVYWDSGMRHFDAGEFDSSSIRVYQEVFS